MPNRTEPAQMMLAINTLIISSQQSKEEVIKMIYLSGVAVNETEPNRIVIKDEPEGNNLTEI